MKLRFRIAMLCALLALVWAGALPQTSAGAVHPSDLARLLEPPPGEEESAMTGAFGAYVTLTDPSTGVAVMDTVLPQGWTAQLQTNWNFISTVNPCVATASFTSPDGQAQAVIQTAQDYLESPDNTGLIPYRDGADMTTYITRLAYKNASQFLDMYFSGILGTEGVVIQKRRWTLRFNPRFSRSRRPIWTARSAPCKPLPGHMDTRCGRAHPKARPLCAATALPHPMETATWRTRCACALASNIPPTTDIS